jgi:hypothetical protein
MARLLPVDGCRVTQMFLLGLALELCVGNCINDSIFLCLWLLMLSGFLSHVRRAGVLPL